MTSHAVSAFRILSVRAESVGTTGASRFNKTSLLVSIMADHKVTPEPDGETTKFHKNKGKQRWDALFIMWPILFSLMQMYVLGVLSPSFVFILHTK